VNKRDSNIAASPVVKGTVGAKWLGFLQGAGEATGRAFLQGAGEDTRRAHDDADRADPDWSQAAASLPVAESAQPAKQHAATAGSGPRSRDAKAEKLFSAGRES
jgi:hypothetical protein